MRGKERETLRRYLGTENNISPKASTDTSAWFNQTLLGFWGGDLIPGGNILCQPVEFVDELVDLAVGGVDFALKAGFLLRVVRG